MASAVLAGRQAQAAQVGVEALEQAVAGAVVFVPALLACFVSVFHIIERRRWAKRERALAGEVAEANARADRASLFLNVEPQVSVAWDRPGAEPRVEGDVSLIADAPVPRRILAFSAWLPPETASLLDSSVKRLLERGEAFSATVESTRGRFFEVDGRAVSGAAVLRIRDISNERLQLARLRSAHEDTARALAAARALFDSLAHPAWTRDRDGAIAWVNRAYASAVEAKTPGEAAERALELFDQPTREAARLALAEKSEWRARAATVAAGERRTYDVVEIAVDGGAIGFAEDQTAFVSQRAEMERHLDAQMRMLDQLTTAVAIFDRTKRLVSYNAAYRQIWSLDAAFLDQKPSDGEILDRLRGRRQLPEQADFRNWKIQLLNAYRSLEPIQQIWHLPDGRTLRVVMSPNSHGGVTYLYDDATQSFTLASQVNALTRVQGETLDALKEGVAVFGADGRMKLANPAFATLWRFDLKRADARPHIDEFVAACAPLEKDTRLWERMRAEIVGLPDKREAFEARMERKDGVVLDCFAMPLPDGATMLAFLDSTASANVERALKERNEALVSAEKLRNDFVNHVSYELRTPLTSIIGFTQLLAEGGVGPLNARQLEYAHVITKSSAALLAIINDILDLASVDAGALELRLEAVDVAEAMRAAAEGVQDRLSEFHIELRIVATEGVGTFRADGRRVRQVLFNLLSNAVGFSEPGQTVTLAAMRRGEEIVFKVSDRGRGIPPEMLDRVFDRFHTHTAGSRHRGPGLGLSLVKALVELHGGRVAIDSAPNEGTTVTCFFPAGGVKVESAAA